MSAYLVHRNRINAPVSKNFGAAWVMLCAALAIHVTDEALTHFLSVYNPVVQAIRSRLPLIPVPTFSFRVWLTGLITAVILLFSLSTFAFREARPMKLLSYVFGIMMFGNALLHLGGSLYMGRPMPGSYSAPLLLACSLYLLVSVYHSEGRNR
jgi:Protein of unknown function with HXXEE motif